MFLMVLVSANALIYVIRRYPSKKIVFRNQIIIMILFRLLLGQSIPKLFLIYLDFPAIYQSKDSFFHKSSKDLLFGIYSFSRVKLPFQLSQRTF